MAATPSATDAPTDAPISGRHRVAVTRLKRRFPDVPSETLATTAAESFEYFADARVRHYVPVLALKRASRQLSGRFDTRGDAGGAA